MMERCDLKFNASKTYLRINVIHLNACKIEKFKFSIFSHLLVSTNFFSFI